MRRYFVVFAILLGVAIGAAVFMQSDDVAAQSSTRGQDGQALARQPFEAQFWNYLQQANYKNWAPAPGQNGDFYEGQSPHGAFLKMYLNRTAIANAKNLPNRSIVIKENYGPDKKTLMAVTVMYRSKGYDPAHNDWYWIKYNPDGTVAKAPPAMGSMPLAGKVNGCIKCHGDADCGDFAFLND